MALKSKGEAQPPFLFIRSKAGAWSCFLTHFLPFLPHYGPFMHNQLYFLVKNDRHIEKVYIFAAV